MDQRFINIGLLIGCRRENPGILSGKHMDTLPVMRHAWLHVRNGRISDFGPMDTLDGDVLNAQHVTDVGGGSLMPTWVDSHTHLVFAGPRDQEFEDRIHGLSYQEIAARGGGILNSAARLAEMEEDTLYEAALHRLNKAVRMGTGAIEIKSGYGLSLETELKMLRVIQRLKSSETVPVRATFLGAHAVPARLNGDREAYVREIIETMIPAVASEGLADYIDAFCETGYFSVADLDRILEAGTKHGLKPKTHVNQFSTLGGVACSVRHGAITVDHLEELDDADIEALRGSSTIPVALPLCSLFLSIPFTPARRLIDAGLPLAIATDFNPGSAPSGNMHLAVALGCIRMGLTPAEAIQAGTVNGAGALEWDGELGSITPGQRANFMVLDPMARPAYLPYAFGESHIRDVYIDGKKFN